MPVAKQVSLGGVLFEAEVEDAAFFSHQLLHHSQGLHLSAVPGNISGRAKTLRENARSGDFRRGSRQACGLVHSASRNA